MKSRYFVQYYFNLLITKNNRRNAGDPFKFAVLSYYSTFYKHYPYNKFVLYICILKDNIFGDQHNLNKLCSLLVKQSNENIGLQVINC